MASRTHFQVLENCPVFGSKAAQFFELLKFCSAPEKFFEDLFFWRTLAPVFLALSISVLGLERVCPRPRIFFVSLALCPRLHIC